MLPQPVRIARLLTGDHRRYIVKNIKVRPESGNLVEVRGEVLRVSGLSTMHGPDKKFNAGRVSITVDELTPELLEELRAQGEKA